MPREDRTSKEAHARVVPESPSYFTAQPSFTDDYLVLQSLLKRYASLPTVLPADAPRAAWRQLPAYRRMVGESVRASEYTKIRAALTRLNLIHPSIVPAEVAQKLEKYKRDVNPFENVTKPIPIDRFGRALGVGRRKSSTAQAWVLEGTGEVLINGKTLVDAFARIHDRESAIWALKSTDRIDKYNVWALVSGGGTTGQAEAMALAVAKALIAHEPGLKPALRRGKIRIEVMESELEMLTFSSWVRDSRSEKGGEEKAWSRQGEKDAGLGQEIEVVYNYCTILFEHLEYQSMDACPFFMKTPLSRGV